ncbi:MAG: PqqD family protein [Acidobacteria bacterium]|nr:PqqD family protein [Acidobacteriota bacterium]
MTSRVRISTDVVFQVLDGEAVLLHLQSGAYFALNETGTRIWGLIEKHSNLARVRAVMLAEYDVAPGALDADIAELVERLIEKELLVREA